MLPPLGGAPGGLMDWGSLKSNAALKTRSFKLLTDLSIIPHLIFYHSSGIICLKSTTFSNCTGAEDTVGFQESSTEWHFNTLMEP